MFYINFDKMGYYLVLNVTTFIYRIKFTFDLIEKYVRKLIYCQYFLPNFYLIKIKFRDFNRSQKIKMKNVVTYFYFVCYWI